MPQHDPFHAPALHARVIHAHDAAPAPSPAQATSLLRGLLYLVGVALPLWAAVALATWWWL